MQKRAHVMRHGNCRVGAMMLNKSVLAWVWRVVSSLFQDVELQEFRDSYGHSDWSVAARLGWIKLRLFFLKIGVRVSRQKLLGRTQKRRQSYSVKSTARQLMDRPLVTEDRARSSDRGSTLMHALYGLHKNLHEFKPLFILYKYVSMCLWCDNCG